MKASVEIACWISCLVGSAIATWFVPQKYSFPVIFGALGVGLFFDVVSLFYAVMTLRTGRYMSGFPGVSLLCYAWLLVALKFPLVARHETRIDRIILFKLVDAGILYGFSFLCHLPASFQPRERSDDED
ncbi:hypothetical protein QT970_14405 [Microcoleus sp. herbarium8]|uniref:hypothetical protein n=1 Tax=Microcoleus sp. herbarium8 TaxID=3055436 RepID=UPI002FD645E7